MAICSVFKTNLKRSETFAVRCETLEGAFLTHGAKVPNDLFAQVLGVIDDIVRASMKCRGSHVGGSLFSAMHVNCAVQMVTFK